MSLHEMSLGDLLSYCASRYLECCLSLGAPLSGSRWIRLELPAPQPWLFVRQGGGEGGR